MSRNWPGKIGRTWESSEPWLEPIRRPAKGAPNVLMIVLDDVGFAHFGCYGSTIATPNIDRLAAGGRRYTNFHTTAMCSPTRASLLTGCNHHAVGMGIIADMCTGYPGYLGEMSESAATLPQMLVPAGYSAFAIGKWHLTRARDMSPAGPFGHWPLGRGFERYYGFLYSLVDQWHPELVCDNRFIDTPADPGYHLSEDLVDQTIGMIGSARAADPERPFFAYLAFGACHSPHQAPDSYIDAYRGAFDEGWDAVRAHWFQRQIEMGIVPEGTALTARSEGVPPWETLTPEEKRLAIRHQEVFAGFLTHTDAQIGRLTGWLERRGMLDDTMILLLSDNGAEGGGDAHGTINLRRAFQGPEESLEEKLAATATLGTAEHWNNYPRGWAHAGNTPHKWYKTHTHNGGIRDPLIVHWPARIRDGGGISRQFCHCSDLAPTILEAAGVTPPATINGRDAMPITGTSIAYTFDAPDAPTRKQSQYFELMGNRGIWANGWKAVVHHETGADYDSEQWELYRLDSDFSENDDLAARHPEKLAELKALWEREAEANHVFPLDDRYAGRLAKTYHLPPRRRWDLGEGRLYASGYSAPSVGNRSYRFDIEVDLEPRASGAVFAAGGKPGGYVLHIDGGRLVHEYVGPRHRTVIESEVVLPAGRHALTLDFRKTGDCKGELTLLCDGDVVAAGSIADMWPVSPMGGGFTLGYDNASPVSDRYAMPARLTGRILSAAVACGDDFLFDPEAEARIAYGED
ncbi:arylsulfatase [Sphingomonas canadensis]|uniref:Arylsulfatase n=1 Tax=Sphingomonas canadensis TaxID=1219257 RepID=A0ABW3HET1_9SPHN|nr:arylsulfatase [Sphingomonas canadensis]MCW3838355.1 arylsulfatase [Sphingomonas canadensis]